MFLCRLFLILGPLLAGISECAFEFETHHFIQFNVRGIDYGLPFVGVNGKLRRFVPETYGFSEDSDKFDDELLKLLRKDRKVYVLKLEDLLTKKFYWSFFRVVLRTTNSLVLLVPKKEHVLFGKNEQCDELHGTPFANPKLPRCKSLDTIHQDTLATLEDYLYKVNPKCSVSISEIDDSTKKLLEISPTGGGILEDDYRISTDDFRLSNVGSLTAFNVYVGGAHPQAEINMLPPEQTEWKERKRAVIAAGLDTFGLMQSYSSMAHFNSGLIVLLELSRLFKDAKSETFDLAFVLHTGAFADYTGLSYFFKNYKGNKDFAFVANLYDLTGDELYIHMIQVNEFLLQPYVRVGRRTPQALEDKLPIADIVKLEVDPNTSEERKQHQMEMVKKRMMYFGKELSLPHEIDFTTNYRSFTLTSTRDPKALYKSSRSLNFRFDVDLVTRRVVQAAEALAKALEAGPLDIDVGDAHAQEAEIRDNVRTWQERLSEPRDALTTSLLSLKPVTQVLSELEANTSKLQVQNMKAQLYEYIFRNANPVVCTVFAEKHAFFDLLVMGLVGMYILLVWSVLRGSVWTALTDIKELLQEVVNEKNFKAKGK